MSNSARIPIPRPSSAAVHNVMAANRGTNTGPEEVLRKSLRRAGVSGYRLNYRVAGVRVDLAFPSRRVAVLVNGCFWHHCPVCDLPLPKTHSDFWAKKFSLTRIRDSRVRVSIKRKGWRLIEVWEHQIREDLPGCVRLVATATNGGVSRISDMPADYIVELRDGYVRSVVNAMIAAVLSKGQDAFTRGHALLSLLTLSKDHPKRYFGVKDVFDEASSNQGYGGGEQGIRAGLEALFSSGIVWRTDVGYRIHPRLRNAVARHAPDLKGAITTAQG